MQIKIPQKSKKIEPILIPLKEELRSRYGEKLQQLILFGSYARGTQNKESDIDLLLVLNDMTSYKEESDKIFDFKYDLSLKSGIYISIHITTQKRFDNLEELLYYNVKKEGIVI